MNYTENIESFLKDKGYKLDKNHVYKAFNFRDFESYFYGYCLQNNLNEKDVEILDNFLKNYFHKSFDFKIDESKTVVFHVNIYHEDRLYFDTLIYSKSLD